MLLELCRHLADSGIGRGIRESDNLFSVIETVHVLAVISTAGIVALVDLRILGAVLRQHSLEAVLQPLLRLTWAGFGVMATSGLLLFWSEADKLYFNAAFRLKIMLLILAAINQWAYHAFAHKSPRRGPWHAAGSLALWIGIIVLGRAIAYL